MTGAQTVLALEFRGAGDTADFGFLAREGVAGLVRVDPLVHHVDRPLTLSEQAALVAARLPDRPALVLAYCGTAALALHVSALTGTPALLVDPYPVTVEDMVQDFRRLCAATGIDPDTAAEPATGPDVARWERALSAGRDAMADVHGGDEEAYEMVDDLLDRYRAWLRFLQASRAAEPVAPAAPVVGVTARPDPRLDLLVADPAAVELHRVDVPAGLLDSPEVRARLTAAIHRYAPTAAAAQGNS
ncbi:hypothetical protein OG535_33560 [Kitasatospora sp. NBC_00085]|uniref:hypothetical protein n=1 Tax=unclassified Kitasatospora TaxID=2633591 RepID=UPI00325487F4